MCFINDTCITYCIELGITRTIFTIAWSCRVPCDYKDQNLALRVEESSQKPHYLAVKVLYQGGQTEIVAMDVAQVSLHTFLIIHFPLSSISIFLAHHVDNISISICTGWFIVLELHEQEPWRGLGHEPRPRRGIAVPVRGDLRLRREVDLGQERPPRRLAKWGYLRFGNPNLRHRTRGLLSL